MLNIFPYELSVEFAYKVRRLRLPGEDVLILQLLSASIHVRRWSDRDAAYIRNSKHVIKLLRQILATAIAGKTERLQEAFLILHTEFHVHFGRDQRQFLCLCAAPHIAQPDPVRVEARLGQLISIPVAAGILVSAIVVQTQQVQIHVFLQNMLMTLFEERHGIVDHPRVLVHIPHNLLQPAEVSILVHQVERYMGCALLLNVQDIAKQFLRFSQAPFRSFLIVGYIGNFQLLQIRWLLNNRIKVP